MHMIVTRHDWSNIMSSNNHQSRHLVFLDTNQYVTNVVIPVFEQARDAQVLMKVLLPMYDTPLESEALLPGMLDKIPVHVMTSDDLQGQIPGRMPMIPNEQIDLCKHVFSVQHCFQFYFIALMNARTRVSINNGPWYVIQAYRKENRDWVKFNPV